MKTIFLFVTISLFAFAFAHLGDRVEAKVNRILAAVDTIASECGTPRP